MKDLSYTYKQRNNTTTLANLIDYNTCRVLILEYYPTNVNINRLQNNLIE